MRESQKLRQFASVPGGNAPLGFSATRVLVDICILTAAAEPLPFPLPSIFLNNRKNSSNPNLLQQWTEKRYYTGAIEHNSLWNILWK